jgi:hypothetical protein
VRAAQHAAAATTTIAAATIAAATIAAAARLHAAASTRVEVAAAWQPHAVGLRQRIELPPRSLLEPAAVGEGLSRLVRMEGGGWESSRVGEFEGGRSRVQGGGRKVEAGRWRAEAGGRREEGGGWRVEGGGWRVEGGGWRLESWVVARGLGRL